MESVTRHPASTAVPALQARQTRTFAFALLDLKVTTVKKVRVYWIACISFCYLVFSVLFQIVTSKDVLCY